MYSVASQEYIYLSRMHNRDSMAIQCWITPLAADLTVTLERASSNSPWDFYFSILSVVLVVFLSLEPHHLALSAARKVYKRRLSIDINSV